MKKLLLLVCILGAMIDLSAQEVKVITVVESIVPMGLGRSRIVEHQGKADATKFTTERTDGKTSKQAEVKRADAKIDTISETKLLNFYSGVGINFQNIASNDALISSKITNMLKQGWTLSFVTSAVESVGGKDDKNGIFITRLYFIKQ